MQNIKNYLSKYMAVTLYIFFKIVKNFVYPSALKHKCHILKMHYYYVAQNYQYYTVPEYCKLNNIKENSYEIESGKIYVLNNFYIDYNESCPKIHDGKGNILQESYPYNNKLKQNKHLFNEECLNDKKNSIKYIDKAMQCALKSGKNYWHFTFTALDQIFAMEKSGFTGKYLLWNKSFIKELVTLAGIHPDKLVFVNEDEVYQVNELHIIDDYCWGSPKNPKLLQELKNKIISNIDMSDINHYPKKLYIKRKKPYTRCIKNEPEILKWLDNYDFKIMTPDDCSVSEQIKYFYAAEMIITPHGACSTNALFMRPETHFIECFGHDYVNPCMLSIIKNNNLYYNMIVEQAYYNINGTDYNINLSLLDNSIYKYIDVSEKDCKEKKGVE